MRTFYCQSALIKESRAHPARLSHGNAFKGLERSTLHVGLRRLPIQAWYLVGSDHLMQADLRRTNLLQDQAALHFGRDDHPRVISRRG